MALGEEEKGSKSASDRSEAKPFYSPEEAVTVTLDDMQLQAHNGKLCLDLLFLVLDIGQVVELATATSSTSGNAGFTMTCGSKSNRCA